MKHGACLGHPAWALEVGNWDFQSSPLCFLLMRTDFLPPFFSESQIQNCSVVFGIPSCHSNLGSHLCKLTWLSHGFFVCFLLPAVTLPLNGFLLLFRWMQLQSFNWFLYFYNSALPNVFSYCSQFFTNNLVTSLLLYKPQCFPLHYKIKSLFFSLAFIQKFFSYE